MNKLKVAVLSVFMASSLMFVPFVHAQNVGINDMSRDDLKMALVAALQQLLSLYQQLAVLQNQTLSVSEPVISLAVPTSTDSSVPIVINVVPQTPAAPIQENLGMGAPSEQVVSNSCSLTASIYTNSSGYDNALVSWSSQGSVGLGSLYDNYKGRYNGGVIQWDKIGDVQANGSRDSLQSFTNAKLVFADGTTCYATSTK